ncbi:MAG: hypothetical protein GY694_00405 [Gammaproteobacteria bacterium]|nr:hypothetical protein [Gammaproteobacteria bacterium]
MNFKNFLAIFFAVSSLTSCAVYKSEFSCPDAKGADCTSVERVYQMIESGEIAEYTESKEKKCKGKNCKKGVAIDEDRNVNMYLDEGGK